MVCWLHPDEGKCSGANVTLSCLDQNLDVQMEGIETISEGSERMISKCHHNNHPRIFWLVSFPNPTSNTIYYIHQKWVWYLHNICISAESLAVVRGPTKSDQIVELGIFMRISCVVA